MSGWAMSGTLTWVRATSVGSMWVAAISAATMSGWAMSGGATLGSGIQQRRLVAGRLPGPARLLLPPRRASPNAVPGPHPHRRTGLRRYPRHRHSRDPPRVQRQRRHRQLHCAEHPDSPDRPGRHHGQRRPRPHHRPAPRYSTGARHAELLVWLTTRRAPENRSDYGTLQHPHRPYPPGVKPDSHRC